MKNALRFVSSTLSAFFGVQSEANRRRDFNDKSPLPYIVTGVVMAALLVLSLVFLVNLVLGSADL
ncbi:DUF2970 domain-containing protein [Corallincola platygyrae]|uniref:DUF2970 domain-containing protein n=1 Tax=Corallincola platygyrae TaxID=1193278 RepID=A0ABW4XP70_9GAMM